MYMVSFRANFSLSVLNPLVLLCGFLLYPYCRYMGVPPPPSPGSKLGFKTAYVYRNLIKYQVSEIKKNIKYTVFYNLRLVLQINWKKHATGKTARLWSIVLNSVRSSLSRHNCKLSNIWLVFLSRSTRWQVTIHMSPHIINTRNLNCIQLI